MLIRDLPDDLRILAKKRTIQDKAYKTESKKRDLGSAFLWALTPESFDFWSRVDSGIYTQQDIELIIFNEPQL